MAKKMKPVDVVCIGFGMTSSLAAQELTEKGLQVVALERGQWRNTCPDFAYPQIMDELKYGIRRYLQQDLSKTTLTFHNKPEQTALPMRHLGSFLLGTDVGGSMVHWNGQTWRAMPDDFRYKFMGGGKRRRRHDVRRHDDPGLEHHLRRTRTLLLTRHQNS